MTSKKWIVDSERVVVESKFISVLERDCRSSEDSRPHRFYLLKSRDWCNIIPITEDGNIVLVRQYRVGISEHTLEIPGGVVDATDSDPRATALREMTEETGYAPIPGAKIEDLGWNYPNPAIQDNRCFSFAVGPVRKVKGQQLDYGEMIDVIEKPLSEVPELIRSGAITHALILNAFLMLGLQSEEGALALTERMTRYRQCSKGETK